MSATYLRAEIILLGVYLLFILLSCILVYSEKKNFLSFLQGLGLLLFLGVFPALGLCINVKKYFSKPEPIIVFDTCIDGKNHMIYQDITHLCDASNKNSTAFTSFIPLSGELSQTDTCIICWESFLDHNTRAEQSYFDVVSAVNESMNY